MVFFFELSFPYLSHALMEFMRERIILKKQIACEKKKSLDNLNSVSNKCFASAENCGFFDGFS